VSSLRDRSKGYVWAVYPGYDIFLATDDGKIVKKMTDAPGYDAEATSIGKTGKIVYTSMASKDSGFVDHEFRRFAKKQITKSEGYDGGAVFFARRQKLVWRANHPETPETKSNTRSAEREI